MQSVKIDRLKLLETIKNNRSNHRALFLKAQEGYRARVITELDAMLQEARGGKRIRRMVQLAEPIDQTNEYDRVILMLEMSVDDVVELSAHEFDCYARDQWQWSQSVNVTNSLYAG